MLFRVKVENSRLRQRLIKLFSLTSSLFRLNHMTMTCNLTYKKNETINLAMSDFQFDPEEIKTC